MMIIEILTQEHCIKCDYLKRLFQTLDVYVEFYNWEHYSQSFIEEHNIRFTPTILIWNDEGDLYIIEKGMTLKNIIEQIKAHTGVEIRKVY